MNHFLTTFQNRIVYFDFCFNVFLFYIACTCIRNKVCLKKQNLIRTFIFKDQERRRKAELQKQKVQEEDFEKNELRRIRQQFGTGQEADRMAQTLLKLQRAYQEGLQLTNRRGTHFEINNADDDY